MQRTSAPRTRNVMSVLTACAVFAAWPALAHAQAGEQAPAQPAPVLSGPEVDDTRAPGTDSRFSPGMQASREMERQVPLRVYEQELRRLGSAEAHETVRLNDEQKTKIDAILHEHRLALRAFFQEHREQMLTLRREAGFAGPVERGGRGAPGEGRGPGAPGVDRGAPAEGGEPVENTIENRGEPAGRRGPRPDGAPGRAPGGSPDTPPSGDGPGIMPAPSDAGGDAGEAAKREAARRRLGELRAKGPADDAAIKRIWEVLDNAQRAHMDAHIESYRAEMMRRREMQKLGEKGGAGAAPADAETGMDRLPERVRQRLESLSPEERERALERLRQRREQARDGGRDATRPKEAPSMDDVDLPESDD